MTCLADLWDDPAFDDAEFRRVVAEQQLGYRAACPDEAEALRRVGAQLEAGARTGNSFSAQEELPLETKGV